MKKAEKLDHLFLKNDIQSTASTLNAYLVYKTLGAI